MVGHSANYSEKYRALDNFTNKEGLNSQDRGSLAKHSGAADEVWYHGYQADWTQREGLGGLP
jgi:hypothetical protein